MPNIRSLTRHTPRIRTAMVLAVAVTFTGCSWSNKAKRTAAATAAGVAVAGVIGNQTGSTAHGAIMGAMVGGATGAAIGRQMDQQAKELKVEIPGAVVQRVGEGIQVTFASGLLLDFDSDAILPASSANLQSLAASLKKYPDTDLLIVGHTDSSGSTDYNRSLSTRRSNAASGYLASQGISPSRMRTSGMGETEPLATNGTEAGRQANRRIEVAIFTTAADHAGGR